MGIESGTAARSKEGGPQEEQPSPAPVLLPLQYDKLSRMVREFQPYLDLWTTASDWLRWSESWMNDPLSAIDAEQLEKNVIESFKTMHKCVKQFKDIPGRRPSQPTAPHSLPPVPILPQPAASHPCPPCPAACQDVALDIRARIEEFKPYIPLIQGLRNPGMRNRHWDLLSNEININVRPKANLTFARCLEMNLQDHIESISKVAEVAGKEYAIEQVGSPQQGLPAPPTCCPMAWEGDSPGPHPWVPHPRDELHLIECVNNVCVTCSVQCPPALL